MITSKSILFDSPWRLPQLVDDWLRRRGGMPWMVGIVVVLAVLAGGIARAEPIRIGMSLGLTGKFAVICRMQRQAFKLWETSVNRSGGILGRKVRLTIHDDASDADTAIAIYRKMIEEHEEDLLFPPYSSELTEAILPITEKYGYPMLIHGAAADGLWQKGYRYAFGVLPPASRYSLGFLEMSLMNGITRVAIVNADDSFSATIARGAEQWSRRLKIEIVFHHSVPAGEKDLSDIARQARQAGAQALIMCGHFKEAIDMRQALLAIDWSPRAYWASVGPVFPAYHRHFGNAANLTFSSTLWSSTDTLPYPGSKAFYKSFLAAYGEEPSYQAAAAYAAGEILAAAIKRADGVNREKIRDVLASMDMMTLLGRYGVDRTGMQIRFFHLVIEWIDGRKQVVWPSDLRTAKPQFAGSDSKRKPAPSPQQ